MPTTTFMTVEGVPIPPPTTTKLTSYNITKSKRLASGMMAMDFIAKKRKIECTWDCISGTELQKMLNIIDTTNMFMNLTYDENGVTKSMICYVGEIPRELNRRPEFIDGEYWWQNYEVHFIEQ